uniref:Uncharacterized protein n=1 Tax=Lactuca sativa TaxID=4236 RepID=A0A9R1UE38_LACSA|nr:hypothetical protein LSAT_V11C900494620 [Lactuca sativa]
MENNLYCCTWLLIRLKEALRQGREVSFIVNMHDVVSSCIEHVFPYSYHGYTSKSVLKCISGGTLQPLFWMTSNSYIVSDFEENSSRLTPDARQERAYFLNICWNVFNIDVPQFFGVIGKSTQCTDNNAYHGNS